MRGLFTMAMATAAALISGTMAHPKIMGRDVTFVTPGGVNDVVITEKNTVNATTTASPAVVKVANAAEASSLKITISNNFNGGDLKAFVTGRDTSGKVVMLSTSGSWYYPDPQGSTTPVAIPSSANIGIPLNAQGQQTSFTLPDYLISGRVYISAGDLEFFTILADGVISLVEPSSVNPSDPSAGFKWGFIELTNNSGGIYANLSFVDFVGLVMGMSLTLSSGSTQTVQGLKPDSVRNICNDMRTQAAADGQPWDKMCQVDSNGTPLRVLSPNLWLSSNTGVMDSYWDTYTQLVWDTFTNQDLKIDTQGSAGTVTCRVSDSTLNCDGDNAGYSRPTAGDIFGCNSGPFLIQDSHNDVHRAVVPRLCAAFTRSTLLLNGGTDVQPGVSKDYYYSTSPTSHYSRIVHSYEIDGLGYAFSYDDVNPDGQNEAGVVSGADPSLLYITVGGPDA